MKVEIKIPYFRSQTSWGKNITEVDEKAKSGYDWKGTFLNCGPPVDASIGDVIISCHVERKTKVVNLYCVAGDDLLPRLRTVRSNNWAVELRDVVRSILSMTIVERLKFALNEIKPPEKGYNLQQCEQAEEKNFTVVFNKGFVGLRTWAHHEHQDKVQECKEWLEELRQEHNNQLSQHALLVQKLKDAITKVEENEN